MRESFVSLKDRLNEVRAGKRETIEGITFWGSCGGDRITMLKFNKQTNEILYRRTFAYGDDCLTSSDIPILGYLGNYFDVKTLTLENLIPIPDYAIHRASACADVGD